MGQIQLTEEQRELLENSFEECEDFNGNCDECNNNGRLWFERSSPEYDEGTYLCDECGLKKIKEDDEFFDNFELNIKDKEETELVSIPPNPKGIGYP